MARYDIGGGVSGWIQGGCKIFVQMRSKQTISRVNKKEKFVKKPKIGKEKEKKEKKSRETHFVFKKYNSGAIIS